MKQLESGNLPLYGIKDTIAETFVGGVQTAMNAEDAVRTFKRSIDKVENREDFALYFLGWINMSTGQLTADEPSFITDDSVLKSHGGIPKDE